MAGHSVVLFALYCRMTPSTWAKVRSGFFSRAIQLANSISGTDKLYVRRLLVHITISFRLTPPPDHPQRVVELRCFRRISRSKRSQIRRSRCKLQAVTIQLLCCVSPTIRASRLHYRWHHLRPHQHPTLDQEARHKPSRRKPSQELRVDQVEFRKER